jgi:threonine/homoserine/homoserine lactone efflux protein
VIASFGTLLAFAITCLVIELTPGPNMAYLAVLSAREGRRAGFAATLGVALGLLIVGLAAALGLTAAITSSRLLYEGLRWAGVIYLLWLAWEGWRAENETSPGKAVVDPADSKFFLRGLITNLLNPKAGIFYIAVLPTFVDETRPRSLCDGRHGSAYSHRAAGRCSTAMAGGGKTQHDRSQGSILAAGRHSCLALGHNRPNI